MPHHRPGGVAPAAMLAAALLLFATITAFGEPLPLLVDTDMGLDDMRAITLLLDAEEWKVHGISTVFGSQEPERGGRAAIRLLGGVGHRRLPVSTGAEEPLDGKFEPPPWRPFCEQATENLFGNKGHVLLREPAHEMLSRLARREGPEVRLVCLGPLTNIALALEADPGLTDQVHTLVVACADTEKQHYNITADPEAADQVLAAPWKRVVLVAHGGEGLGADFGDVLAGIDSERITGKTAQGLAWLCGSGEHLLIGDELAALHLLRPDIFSGSAPFCATVALDEERRGLIAREPGDCGVSAAAPAVEGDLVVRAILDRISGIEVGRPSAPMAVPAHDHGAGGTILRNFPPKGAASYRDDVGPMVARIVEAHGEEEWRWSVLTGEIHGHLGIWSVVGVKMGLRALEVLGAPREAVELAPHCGSRPPLSCLQDGLVVSTGATPGRGLLLSASGAMLLPPLYVDEESDAPQDSGPAAAASFYYGERMISIRVLPEVQQLIEDRIATLAGRHGGTEGHAYFHELRSVALELQLELDRHRIFEVFE